MKSTHFGSIQCKLWIQLSEMPEELNTTNTACQTGFPETNLEIASLTVCLLYIVKVFITDVQPWNNSRRHTLAPELWISDGLASRRDPEHKTRLQKSEIINSTWIKTVLLLLEMKMLMIACGVNEMMSVSLMMQSSCRVYLCFLICGSCCRDN